MRQVILDYWTAMEGVRITCKMIAGNTIIWCEITACQEILIQHAHLSSIRLPIWNYVDPTPQVVET